MYLEFARCNQVVLEEGEYCGGEFVYAGGRRTGSPDINQIPLGAVSYNGGETLTSLGRHEPGEGVGQKDQEVGALGTSKRT